jgi:diaminohydroxyphosphoribosylaminopyrimidine deaminase/5-amino-6-(5-phosphoribosylamino)uracil reductase
MEFEDEKYIRRCLQLARNGLRTTSPNPMVGAVIVCDGKIIGEGYHICYGDWHAEVNAVLSVKDKSLLKRSTMYVSLEPCSHYGKTPPCADMIVEKQIPRIVIGCEDPFTKVNGRGIKKLIDGGCKVKVGVLEKECRHLIRGFITLNTLHRPYVTLKWAESADGFIGAWNKHIPISTPYSLMLVHKRRAENDAILVGTETARIDNPQLNVRYWSGKNPLRVVLDRKLILPESLRLFDKSAPTLVFTTREHIDSENIKYISVSESEFTLHRLLEELAARHIQTLLVEGGGKLHQSFIDAGLWDDIFVEKSDVRLYEGVPAARIKSKEVYVEERILGTTIYHYTRLRS